MPVNHQEFHFALGEPGRAVATYTVDGEVAEFELSNVCNPLGDMLCALAQMLTNPSHLWEGAATAAFVWYAEQESYNWTLAVDKDENLTVRVTQSCEFFGDDEVELVSCRCRVEDFVLCIVRGLDPFIKKMGLLNYFQQWQTAEFPITYLLIIKRHLVERGLWGAEGDDAVNLASEISLLLR